MKRRIFISYRRAENQWAVGHLRERLFNEFGEQHVFFDQESILSGENWRQRLDTELARCSAVVMVFGAGWYGEQAEGRRIDDPNDMVRIELLAARRLDKPVVPVVIDETPPPNAATLPQELQFLLERQFRKLRPADSLDQQTDRLILDIRQVAFGKSLRRHYLMQALWVAAVALSLVWIARATQVVGAAEDAFARTVQLLMTARQPPLPKGYGVVEIDNNDYRELFGGRTPLDPEVMEIFVAALLRASREAQACRPDRPVGINIELAPGESGANDPRFDSLALSLRQLAGCRPVVLACPQSVESGEPAQSDQRWMTLLMQAGEGAGQPPVLASTRLDAALLRHSHGRIELGATVGDLAAGRTSAAAMHEAAECTCAWKTEAAERCQRDPTQGQAARSAAALDRASLVLPFEARRYAFSEALRELPQVAGEGVLLVGGGFGTLSRFAVPFLASTRDSGASAAMVHAYVARAAQQHGAQGGRLARVAVDIVVALGVSAALMALWGLIARYPDRYSRRALGYAGALALLVGIPLACLAVAAWWPGWLWVAAGAGTVSVVTCLRSAVSGYEVLLNQGVAWKSIPGLWQATVNERDRTSARIRLAVACLELLLMVLGLAALWWT